MFQACTCTCVSISACIFYVFMIHRVCVCVCIDGHTAGLKNKNKKTDLPTLFFSSPLRQYNFVWPYLKICSQQAPHKHRSENTEFI